jgi:hypothetical protein
LYTCFDITCNEYGLLIVTKHLVCYLIQTIRLVVIAQLILVISTSYKNHYTLNAVESIFTFLLEERSKQPLALGTE